MLSKLFGLGTLDKRRFQATLRRYDKAGGYGDWHRRCQAAYDGPSAPTGRLDDQGVERVRVLEPARAGDALGRLRAAARGSQKTMETHGVIGSRRVAGQRGARERARSDRC